MATKRKSATTKSSKTKTATVRSRKTGGNGAASAQNSPDDLMTMYKDMLLIRRFEELAGQLYGMGLIGGFCHLYIGQEAVVVGMQAAITEKDALITSYRDHGHMLACGMDPKGVMAELTGRSGGYSRGKGGSMHMFSSEKNFFGGHGIVGAQVSIGTGLAFAQRYKGDGTITLAYFGDGASNQGQVHESFNMAALWKLPVIYVIENNRYGICRAGEGPVILEMMTYRYRGHSMSDPANYRSKEEVAKVRDEQDPISNLKSRLLKQKLVSGDDLKTIDKELRDIVAEAAEFAQNSPEPDPSELYTDVLVEA